MKITNSFKIKMLTILAGFWITQGIIFLLGDFPTNWLAWALLVLFGHIVLFGVTYWVDKEDQKMKEFWDKFNQ